MKTAVFTGKGPESREKMQILLQSVGIRIIDEFRKDVSMVITDDLESPSSIMRKAKRYGIPATLYSDLFPEAYA